MQSVKSVFIWVICETLIRVTKYEAKQIFCGNFIKTPFIINTLKKNYGAVDTVEGFKFRAKGRKFESPDPLKKQLGNKMTVMAQKN